MRLVAVGDTRISLLDGGSFAYFHPLDAVEAWCVVLVGSSQRRAYGVQAWVRLH